MLWQAAAIAVNPDKFEGVHDDEIRKSREVFMATNPFENVKKLVKGDFGKWVNNPLRGYWAHLANAIPPHLDISMIRFRERVRELGFRGNFALMFRFMVTLDTGANGFTDMRTTCNRADLYKLQHALEDQGKKPRMLVVNSQGGSRVGPEPYEHSLPKEVAKLKERLLIANGTLGLAWRNYMDPLDLSQISYTKLNAVMRRDNNHLNPGKIWDHIVSFDLPGMVKGSGALNP